MSPRLCIARGRELPAAQREALHKAVRLEYVSLFFFVTALVFSGLVMGQSQSMKTAWIDDALGVIPPLAVLIAERIQRREPNARYPYGYHRCVTIAFLCAAVALLGLGLALVIDGALVLIRVERPTITSVQLLGREVWLGWLMLAALVWSATPTVFLGRLKHKHAAVLHDKALYSDAEMNRADWMTGVAAILGIVGVGLGWWWADALGGIIISIDITRDGYKNLRTAVADLMDRRPRSIDDGAWDELPAKLEQAVHRLPWVVRARVRMREAGHVCLGEVFIVPIDDTAPFERVREVHAVAQGLDWRIHDLTVQLCDADECVVAGMA